MLLIKIDPQTRTVETVASTGQLDDLRQLINCRMIDVCARQDNGDALIVDDEALYLEPQPNAFRFGNYGQPIHGIALLMGSDEDGDTVEPIMTVEQAQKAVEWLGDIHTTPIFTIIPMTAY